MAVNMLRDERAGSNIISDLTRYRVQSRVLVASAAEIEDCTWDWGEDGC